MELVRDRPQGDRRITDAHLSNESGLIGMLVPILVNLDLLGEILIRLPRNGHSLSAIEGEVAFRFTVDLPKGGAISREDLERALEPFPVIEIVASRFADYEGTPSLVRLADRMSNGGIVLGRAVGKPERLDRLSLKLVRDGETVLDQVGGHPRGDPFLPVLEFVNLVRAARSFPAGEFVTAGTFTGMLEGQVGERWDVAFAGLGEGGGTIS